MGNNYKYKAFISYRHISPDKELADKLQKKLESYKPPRSVFAGEKAASWRIFRDETELPTSSDLSNDIKNALEESEFLIVICSKTTKDSHWCMEEIEYFKKLHNGNNANIITLLAEGNPKDVFPEPLCNELVAVEDEEGNITYNKRVIEPLAANVSGASLRESLKKLNTEFLRIAAPLLGCGYDSLYNREQKKKTKRIFTFGSIVLAVLLLFLVYNSAMLLKINNQKTQLAMANAENLAVISENLWNSGDGIGAIEMALSALPENGKQIPVVPNVMRVLANETGAYKKENFSAVSKFKCKNHVSKLGYAGMGETLVAQDSQGIYFFDAKSGKLKKEYANEDFKKLYTSEITVYFDDIGLYESLGAEKYAVGIFMRNSYNYMEGYKRTKSELKSLSNTDVLVESGNGIYKLDGTTGDILWQKEFENGCSVDVTDTKIFMIEDIYQDFEKTGEKISVFDRVDGNLVSETLINDPAIMLGNYSDLIDVTDTKCYRYDGGISEDLIVSYDISNNELKNPEIIYDSEKDPLYCDYEYSSIDKIQLIGDDLYIVKTHWDTLEYYFITEILVIDKNGNEKWRYSYKNEYSYGSHIRLEIFDKDHCNNYCTILAVAKGNSVELINNETGEHILTYELDGIVMNSYCSKDGFLTVFTSGGYEVAVLGRHIKSKEEAQKAPAMIQLHKFINQHALYACYGNSYAVANEKSNEIYLYSDVSNSDYNEFYTDEENISKVLINKSQTYIAIDLYEKVFLYDIKSDEKYEIVSGDKNLQDVLFMSDDMLAVIDFDSNVSVFDVSTREKVFEKTYEDLSLKNFAANDSLLFRIDGGKLLILDKEFNESTWSPQRKDKDNPESVDTGFVFDVYTFENSNKIMADVHYELENIIEIYDINAKKSVALEVDLSEENHLSSEITSAEFVGENDIVVAFSDNSIKIFDVKTGKLKKELSKDLSSVVSVVSLGNEEYIGILCNDSVLYKVGLNDGTVYDSVELDNDYIKSATQDTSKVECLPKHNCLIFSGWDMDFSHNHAYVIDSETFDIRFDISGYAGFICDGDFLVTENYTSVGSYPLYGVDELKTKAQKHISNHA